jgi:ABC-type antimicrobial peptide transport system permease subunit
MSFGRLLLRNLLYHWRGNFAVFLGVALGTAVLTGALLVGDSLRGSLRDLTLDRLGWVDHALVAGRFIRQEVADEMAGDDVAERISPAIVLQGSASTKHHPSLGRITILGVDGRFWPDGRAPVDAAFWQQKELDQYGPVPVLNPEEPLANAGNQGVVLNTTLARDLHAGAGDEIELHLEKANALPREALLGRPDAGDVEGRLRLKVRAVLADDDPGARFSLTPMPSAPRNAFVPLRLLQEALRLQEEELRVREGLARFLPKRPINAVFVRGGRKDALQADLHKRLKLADWGLVVRPQPQPAHGYLSLESRQLFVEPAVLEAVRQAGLTAAPTLVYIVNNIAGERQQFTTAAALLAPVPVPLLRPLVAYYGPLEVPYSIVAALDPTQPPPLGSFLPPGVTALDDRHIILVQWQGWPLDPAGGDERVSLTYFLPGEEGRLHERTDGFQAVGPRLPLTGAANDRNLTPQVAGITDRQSLDWSDNPPFPYDKTRVRNVDESYWSRYRTTPKAYVTLAAGQKMWGSRFGNLTSIRIVPPPGNNPVQQVEERVRQRLQPEQGGLVFDDVRQRSLEAGAGGTDFGVLFLSFSVFLIAAALLLVGLLFRLNLDRRAAEIGLLLATGYRRGTLAGLLLGEGSLLAVAGGLVGSAAAVLYAQLLLEVLSAWWPGGTLDRSFLRVHVTPWSFLIGYVATLAMSVLAIGWALLMLRRIPPRALLSGETITPTESDGRRRSPRWSLWVGGVTAVGALACIVAGRWVSDTEARAMTFFGSGFLLLIASLAGVWIWMHRTRHGQIGHRGRWAVARLGVRNAARHPVRSLLTAGLLASAAFLVIAVESFHRDTGKDFLDRNSGSGGFSLLAESAVPIYKDLNNPTARRDEVRFPDNAAEAFHDVTIQPFRLHTGDDASCLNLYEPRRPRLLGVPSSLVRRGGFHFAASKAESAEDKANPWRLLEQPVSDGGPIPVIADANTVQWILHSKLGGVLKVPNEHGELQELRIVGLLAESIFQSELLLSEANFLKLYPHHEGYNFFLVATPPERTDEVKDLLAKGLAARGLEVMSTRERLQSYLAVENTYLATFQALGGLGLVLGALGLAVVLLRSVWERRGELALLRALGFRRTALNGLMLAENGFLLILGLGIGAATALLAVAPHLVGGTGEVPWLRLLGLLGLVLVVGLSAGAVAVATTLRAPLLPALRRE